MGYRQKTLRKMPFVTRRLAKLQGELESLSLKLAKLVLEVNSLELAVLAEVSPTAILLAPDRQPPLNLQEEGELDIQPLVQKGFDDF